MAVHNWFEDLLTKIIGESGTDVLSDVWTAGTDVLSDVWTDTSDVWTDTVSPILSPPPERTFGVPTDSPFVRGLNQFRETVGLNDYADLADLAAYAGMPALGSFKMASDIATASPMFMSPPDSFTGGPRHRSGSVAPIIDAFSPEAVRQPSATAATHQAPSLADLYADFEAQQLGTVEANFAAKRQWLDDTEAELEKLLSQHALLQRQGVKGAAAGVASALASLEATRFARLKSDEANARARLESLEATRVAREKELSSDVKARGEQALADYDQMVSGGGQLLGGLSGPPAQSVFGDASRERALLSAQQMSQQDLMDGLATTYANEGVNRGMRLGATYDQAGMDLSDRLWQQNTANDLALQQALSDIDVASKQQEINQFQTFAPMRFENQAAYDAAVSDLEAGAAARGIAGAEQAQMLDLLGPLLGGFPGSPGNTIANEHGTSGLGQIFGAAMQAGIGGTVINKLINPASSGKIVIPIGGRDFTVDEQWYAGKLWEMMSDASVPTRTVELRDGSTITLPVSSFAEVWDSEKVAALG